MSKSQIYSDYSSFKNSDTLVINKKYTEDEISLLLAAPIPKKLEILNKICNVTAKEVSRAIGISLGHYYRLTGGKSPISPAIARKLASLFNLKIEFFGGVGGEESGERSLSQNELFDRRAFLLFNSRNNDSRNNYMKYVLDILKESFDLQDEVFPQNYSMIASDANLAKLSIYPDDLIELMYLNDDNRFDLKDITGKIVKTRTGDFGILEQKNSGFLIKPLNDRYAAVSVNKTEDVEAVVVSVKHVTVSTNDLLHLLFDKN